MAELDVVVSEEVQRVSADDVAVQFYQQSKLGSVHTIACDESLAYESKLSTVSDSVTLVQPDKLTDDHGPYDCIVCKYSPELDVKSLSDHLHHGGVLFIHDAPTEGIMDALRANGFTDLMHTTYAVEGFTTLTATSP